MKVKARTSGSNGGVEYQPGEVLIGDSDHVRSLLVNGLGTPEDEDATNFLARTDEHEQYARPALQALAAELDAVEAPPEE